MRGKAVALPILEGDANKVALLIALYRFSELSALSESELHFK